MFAAVDPNLDGDFKALLEVQKKRQAEKESQRERANAIVLDLLGSLSSRKPSERKISGGKLGGPESQEALGLRQQMMTALNTDDLDTFTNSHKRLSVINKTLLDPELRDPEDNRTVLHESLKFGAEKVTKYLLGLGDQGLIMASFVVTVRGINTEKTIVHVCAVRGFFDILKQVIDTVEEGEARQQYLRRTVLTELEGQRPRHLTGLHLAALHGHTEMVKYFVVSLGIDVNIKNNKQDTPILWASRGNHIETVRALIELGADIGHQNDKGSTPLYWAVRYGFTDLVEVLITEGKADVNQTRKLGLVAPIVLASALGYVDILITLIGHGADPNTKINSGFTALHYAAGQDDVAIVKALLDRKANIDQTNDGGDTALLIATKEHQLQVVQVLAAYGANLSHRNKQGQTVWHYAIDSPNNDMLTSLVDIHQKRSMVITDKITFPVGKTPMHICAIKDDPEKLQCLLDLGVDPNSKDDHGNTFFHLAAKEGSADVLDEFIDQVDVNLQNELEETALHVAARAGHLTCVDKLIKKVKVDLKNENMETALHVACKSKEASREVVALLVDAIVKGHNWSLVDAVDHNGNTALHSAARAERDEIIPALHHLNPKLKNKVGENPLHIAAATGQKDLLEVLLDVFSDPAKGLDIDQLNEEGETLLFIAADHGDADRVEMLINRGADLAIKNQRGNTVFHRLVLESVEDKENMSIYLHVLDRIVSCSVKWYCLNNDLPEPDAESDNHMHYRKQALMYLTSGVTNNDKLSAIALAAKSGNKAFLERLLWIPDVYLFHEFISYKFDITNLTPETRGNPSERKRSSKSKPIFAENTAKVGALDAVDTFDNLEESALDLVVRVTPIELADEMMDIAPLKQIVQDYWLGYQWIYGVLLSIHLIYMSCLSADSVSLLRTTMGPHLDINSTLNVEYTGAKPFPNILYLLWPLLLLGFELYYVILRLYKRYKGIDTGYTSFFEGKLTPASLVSGTIDFLLFYATHMINIFFCLLVILWVVFYRYELRYQAHLLCASLIVGWLFTMAFTKGFETVHSFSIILKHIIIRDITRFFVIYGIILLAFAFGAQALLQLAPDLAREYPSFGDILFLFFNMMIGMGELFSDDFEGDYRQYGYSSVPIKIVYLIYIILATVVMLNLLIARMSDSYQLVSVREGTTWRVNSVQLALQIERSMPWIPIILRAFGLKNKSIYYDEERRRWMMEIPAVYIDKVVDPSFTDTSKALAQLDAKFSTLQMAQHNMAMSMNTWLEKTNEINERLDELALSAGNRPTTSYGRRTKDDIFHASVMTFAQLKNRRKSMRPSRVSVVNNLQ